MDKYAVIGNPIAHSKSPEIHRRFAEQCKQELSYGALLSTEQNFKQDVSEFFKDGLGLNVTLPFKLQALEIADELSELAEKAGAVNTLALENKKLVGYNTDGIGLIRDIQNNHKQTLKNKNVLLLGAGGAARGVILPLLQEGVSRLLIANRTEQKAKDLLTQFSSPVMESLGLDAVPALKSIDMIINASSAGLSGISANLPENLEKVFCHDMVYAAKDTPFISEAKQKGCKQYSDGLGMLVEQAAESFFIWRKVRPETRPVLEALRKQL